MICISQLEAGKQVLRPASPTFQKSVDVIVCGLGTAGSLAALFCGENGLSVLGVEQLSSTSGTHGTGGVPLHYFGFPGGRYEAMDQEIRDFSSRYTCTTAEGRKLYTEQALLRQGVKLLYEATVCGVYLEGSRLIGVRVLTPEGIADYGAKVVMDCTAEAQVAVMAGCQTEYGRKTDGQMQPYSMVSLVHNGERYHYTNVDYGRVNQYDSQGFSQAILFCRSYAITERLQGKELIAQLPMLGIREGRRIIAEEQVTIEDLFADRKTQTPIFYSYADLDKHGWDIAFDGEALGDWAIGANLGSINVTVAIPYKALLPLGFDGILVPCRALGVDRDIASCVRMIPDMKKLAEAAAQWATLAIRQDLPLREVPYSQLKALLTESGCLNHPYTQDYRIDGAKDWDGSPLTPEDVYWITDPTQLETGLKTEKPGIAIWSAKRMGTPAIGTLSELLGSGDENTRKHAAFALAILGRTEGLQVLRDTVMQRDALMLKDNRKNNTLRGCMAIYWLGRLADRLSLPELISILCDPREQNRPIYHDPSIKTTRYEISDFQGVYFQFATQAVMALIRIGDAHTDLRPVICDAFTQAFSDDTYYESITKRPKSSSEGDQVLGIKNLALATVQKWNL